MRDIESVFDMAQGPAPKYEEIPTGKVEYYWKGSIQPIINYLKNTTGFVSIDIETNGIRPYKENSKILSVSITDTNSGIAFGLNHPQVKYNDPNAIQIILKHLHDFLVNPKITKICHNAAFEMEWFAKTYSWNSLFPTTWHDTMAQAYLLDCRRGGHSLDFLIQQAFGLKLKPFSKIDCANLENENIEAVLHYNGFDPIYTAKLFNYQQEKIISLGMTAVYEDQINRIAPFVVVQLKGFPVNRESVETQRVYWEGEVSEASRLLGESPEIINYNKIYGRFDYGNKECMGEVICQIIK